MGTSTQVVETIAIVDLGNDIQITYSESGYVYTFNKLQLKMKQTDKLVYITNADGFINTYDNQVIPLDYTLVSVPAGLTSPGDLFDAISGMVSGVSLGGGASAGGGASVWSTKQGHFTAVITASTKNITVTGLPWTLEAQNVAIVEKFDSAGDKSTLKLTNVVVSGGVITLGDEDDFASGDVVSVTLIGPDKAYDEGGDQGLTFVTNPDSEKWTSPEHLVDISAQAAGTLRYVIPMEGFKDLSMHWKFSNSNAGDTVTMTLWATNNADADDSADTDWVDVSGDYLSKTLTVTNGTIEFAEVLDNLFFLKAMVKLVVASVGDTNAADIYIKKKAL
jgi:hypothetical protein